MYDNTNYGNQSLKRSNWILSAYMNLYTTYVVYKL